MRKFNLVLVALALFLTISGPSVAQPASQQLRLEITSPGRGEQVRGRIPIMGSASVPSFQFYKVEFGLGPNPGEWHVIGDLHYEPVVEGQLEAWDTTALPDGVYSLRLQGVKQDGNWEEFVVQQIAIANQEPTSTPTRTVTPTSAITNTPQPTATPEPTPTQQILRRDEEELTKPTPTPTLSRPTQERSELVNPKNWLLSLGYGGLSMAVVFVLLGIIFGIRKLL